MSVLEQVVSENLSLRSRLEAAEEEVSELTREVGVLEALQRRHAELVNESNARGNVVNQQSLELERQRDLLARCCHVLSWLGDRPEPGPNAEKARAELEEELRRLFDA